MIWDIVVFFLGAGCATAVCWWFWKSSADERASLKARIRKLEDDLSSRFKSS
jgi:hypothetical protein